jgi:hypothetical protein
MQHALTAALSRKDMVTAREHASSWLPLTPALSLEVQDI